MTSLPRTSRFLIDREFTPQDIETMNYWCAIKEAETQRAINVVNNYKKLKEIDNAKPQIR